MDTEVVVYIYNGILLGNEKEWNMAFCSNMDGTGGYYAKWNKPHRERQIPYVFTLMWILRNLTEDCGGGEGKKKLGRESNLKRLLKTENELRVDGVEGRGKWVMGIEEGTCWDEHWVLYGNQFDNKFHIKNFFLKKICCRWGYRGFWSQTDLGQSYRSPTPWHSAGGKWASVSPKVLICKMRIILCIH